MTREKTSGVKLRAAAGACGLPHAVWEAAADAGGRDGAVEMLRKCAPCDGGCSAERTKDGKSGVFLYEKRAASGKNFANAVRLTIDAEAEAVKRSELHTFVVLPRWRVAGKVPPSLEKL